MKKTCRLIGPFSHQEVSLVIVLLFACSMQAAPKALNPKTKSLKSSPALSPKQSQPLVPSSRKTAQSEPAGKPSTPEKDAAPAGGSLRPRKVQPASGAMPSRKPSAPPVPSGKTSMQTEPSSIKSIIPAGGTPNSAGGAAGGIPATGAGQDIKSIFQTPASRDDLWGADHRDPFPEPVPGDGSGSAPTADGFILDSVPGEQAGNGGEDIFRPDPFKDGRPVDEFTGTGRGGRQDERFVPGQDDPERDQYQQEQRIRTGRTVDRDPPFPDNPGGGPDESAWNIPDQGQAKVPRPPPPPTPIEPDDPDDSVRGIGRGETMSNQVQPGGPAENPKPKPDELQNIPDQGQAENRPPIPVPPRPPDPPDDPDDAVAESPAGNAADLSRTAHARSPSVGDENGPNDPRSSAADGAVALPGFGEAASPAIGDEGEGGGGSTPGPEF